MKCNKNKSHIYLSLAWNNSNFFIALCSMTSLPLQGLNTVNVSAGVISFSLSWLRSNNLQNLQVRPYSVML